MGKVYSEFFDVTVDGNILTRHNNNWDILEQVSKHRTQFTVVRTGGTDQQPLFDISYPMNSDDHRVFAALIHRANSENKVGKKLDTNGKGPDNDGPKPTNPRGSGGQVVEQKDVFAVAA